LKTSSDFTISFKLSVSTENNFQKLYFYIICYHSVSIQEDWLFLGCLTLKMENLRFSERSLITVEIAKHSRKLENVIIFVVSFAPVIHFSPSLYSV
jgi:hypothetical protein